MKQRLKKLLVRILGMLSMIPVFFIVWPIAYVLWNKAPMDWVQHLLEEGEFPKPKK